MDKYKLRYNNFITIRTYHRLVGGLCAIIIDVLNIKNSSKNKGVKMKESFEEQIEKLEQIVNELEKGDLSLEDSVSKFEEGIKISKECNKTLEEAEKKITILVNREGEMKEENFQTEE